MSSMSSAIAAGRAYVELLLKDDSFKAKLKQSSETMAAWGKGLKAVGKGTMIAGMAMLAPFIAAIPMFASGGAALDDLSQRIAAPVEDLQRLAYAGDMAGISLEGMTPGLITFQKWLAKSGKSGSDLAGQLALVADELQGIEDPAKRIEFMAARFGDAGAKLIPLLSAGSGALKGSMGRADSLGLVISKEDIAAAARLDDAYTELMMTLKGLGNTLAAAVVPYLSPIVEYSVQIIAATTKWVNENRGLAATFAAIGTLLVTVGGALVTLGTVVGAVGAALAALTPILAAVSVAGAPVILTVLAIVAAVAALAAGISYLMGMWGGATEAAEDHTQALAKLREQQAAARMEADDAPDADKALGKAQQIIRPANIGFMNAGAADRFGVGFKFNDNVPEKRQVKLSEQMLEFLKKIEKKTGPLRAR